MKPKKKENNKQEDWKGKYQRALADYQNLIRQQAKDKQEFVKYANSELLIDLLPVYNHLRLSLQHAPAENNAWLQGVQYVVKQFKDVLTARGVKEVMTKGVHFDHQTMEAVEEIKTDDEKLADQVAKELSPGYTLHERTIIPAKVAVYKYESQKTNK